ncbi:3-dehydroquinate dehydratase [Alkalispirochaeta americana]|uniref:shikimate dehydrogenase (NADP(+)) n=1 Tax=Alkalispirochaeta americana TaxID=159291 RepID=A0A1N6TEP3_9SPIO|nr:type I 3-dehydroquinate dehydratase [Alkalispirochaeta americana]SIQ51731.1 3-dehydroquinate dehydratase [Alkalispirochaeta americana]
MICLCLTGDTLEAWTRQLETNRPWISLVELRVDLLKPSERDPGAIRRWWEASNPGVPAVLTIRRVRDLGRWEGDDAQRVFLFEALQEALSPDYVDIELDRRGHPLWDQIALLVRSRGGTVIRSHHVPRETPQDLSQLMARLAADPKEVAKLAVATRSAKDLVELIRAADTFRQMMPGRRAIWVGMGEHGFLTRAFPARLRSLWTYASDSSGDDPDAVAAPGQVDARMLAEVYRVDQARSEWPVFAVLGAPVAHSRSPRYHNERFAREGIKAIYLPLRLDSFSDFSALAQVIPLEGASVTVPHKVSALSFAVAVAVGARTCGTAALRAGAANTLVRSTRDECGGWYADNTDEAGFLEPLQELRGDLAGLRTAVIGAGGAARAVAAGLFAAGVEVHVFNRTRSRAQELVRDCGIAGEHAHGLQDLAQTERPFDILVQTTSVGMGDDPLDPIPQYTFTGEEIVYDIIYTPPETPLLKRARAAGCKVINGQEMFQRQAAAQFRLFSARLGELSLIGGAPRSNGGPGKPGES